MKTNKISAMLLSAAIACTPVLSSAAQIVASAEETTTTTAVAAETAVSVPVAIDPNAVVVAANPDDTTEANTTEATTQTTAQTTGATTGASTTTTTAATTVAQKDGNATFDEKPVNEKAAASNAMVEGMSLTLGASDQGAIVVNSNLWKQLYANNPNFNPYDNIYRFRVPNANEGKMLYTPNPRWFINTPAPAIKTDSGDSATITWDPVPGADGYRYSIRTWVMQPDADSHSYAFNWTQGAADNTGAKSVTPAKTVEFTMEPISFEWTNPKTNKVETKSIPATKITSMYEIKTNAAGLGQYQKDGNIVKCDEDGEPLIDYVLSNGNKVLVEANPLPAGVNKGVANENYVYTKFDPIFRVKEGITLNAFYQPQDNVVSEGYKSGVWREFNVSDRNLVTGYCYDLEHPSVTVSADVPVRIEIMIQAFRIDNATGNLYNLSDVSQPRVVDINWVAGESWEGYAGMPDQYEDEIFRAEYHKLNEDVAKPGSFKMTWKKVTLPVTKDLWDKIQAGTLVDGNGKFITLESVTSYTDKNGNQVTIPMNNAYDDDYGYVTQTGNAIKHPENNDLTVDTKQIAYITLENYEETFDLSSFDPTKQPTLYDVSDDLKKTKPAKWALNSSANQAIKDDFDRKVKAYNDWKRLNVDPIVKWNTDHAGNVEKAWRTAYKECIKAYAQSEFVNNKGYSMRYGLLDLDRNGTPELIVSFSSKADKNSYVVIDFQADRAKLRTVHDRYGTEWYYEDVLGGCARRGRCFKLDNLAPIDDWTPASDDTDPLATTSSGSGSSSASSSAGSSSSSSSAASASGAAAPKTGDAGVAGLVAAAAAAVAGLFGSAAVRRKKD